MGARRDGTLALVSLLAFVTAVALVDASLSPPALALGGIGTVAFELLATRDSDLVRRHWERPAVQGIALAAAVGVAAVGARVAPSLVLSAGIGALVAYLVVLASVLGAASVGRS
ncbi:hypothetical protein ACFOZ7_19020 [Natribaculum luteum]|uniref:Phosphatidate cytidylyltransferase n=1 Tax=Natribaculum luteum TaxID=1586232 RepID=A0ABD5P3U2_9EURY|nr:hypothetical protein [Natribaculum luteum]